MHRAIRLTAIALLAMGGVIAVPRTHVVADEPAKTEARNAAANAIAPGFSLPAGVTSKELKDEAALRKAFGSVTQSALKKNGFDDIADRLVVQDKDRIKEYKQKSDDQLNAVVEKIHAQWKDKYHHDFDMDRTERAKAFNGVVFRQGEISNPDQLAGNWPISQALEATASSVVDNARTAAAKEDIDKAKAKYFGGDVKLEKGRDVAVAQVPADMGLPEVRCSLIHEHLSGWKFDIPNNITGQQLHDKLFQHLTLIADHPEQWPGDADAAYGMVAHHVLMTLYNIEPPARETK